LTTALAQPGLEDAALAPGAMSPGDLAELLGAFNEVTARLQRTHESLRAEVARLSGELSQANEQLERSRRLAGLGQMAAGIAHEVRNPLGSIGLYARMLMEDLADRPQERRIAGKIAAAVRGLDGVVGDVLSFARQLQISLAPACPAELMERALDAAVPGGVSVEVRRCWGPELPFLDCDADRVHQALVNIIRNALEAMDEIQGERVLTLGISARCLGERDAAGLWVADTGPGVNAEVVERMFNPFFTTRAAGTGLGLAIVHRIIDAHGGRVEVRNNTSGQGGAPGATVELILPVRDGLVEDPLPATIHERSRLMPVIQESHA
jgi:signal transduction histidine kinase